MSSRYYSTFFCHLIAIVTVIIWGSTFVFTKLLLLAGLSPAQIFTLRFVIAYVLLLLFSLSRSTHRWCCRSWRGELLMVALGVTGGSLYFLAENEALRYTTTTNASLIVCSCPLFTSLLVGAFYKSLRLRRVQLVGMLLAAAGLVMVVLNGHFVLHLSPVGDTLAFVACLCWAVYSLLLVPANQRYDAVFITRKVFFYGLLTMLPYYLMRPAELSVPWHQLLHSAALWDLLYLGVVASMLCFLLWTWVMDCLGAVVATNYVFLNPVSTIVFAWWLLGESITPWFLLGTILILTGLYFSDRPQRSRQGTPVPGVT